MASINLIESFQDFKDAENIDRPTLMKVLEDVFKTLLRKKYGSDESFDVIVNTEKGDLEIVRHRMIVEDGAVENPLMEIEYSEAVKIEPDFEVGEELYEEVDIMDFGRRAILAAKQTLASRIGDLKKNALVKNTVTVLVISSMLRFTRYGKKKFCSLMRMEMNSSCPSLSRSLLIISKKEKASAL